MSRIKAAVTLSFLLMALLAGLTLRQSPVRVISRSSAASLEVASTVGDAVACQSGESLPRRTSAIRLGLESSPGPPVLVRLYSGARVIAEGRRAPGWTGTAVTVPIQPLRHSIKGVTLCFRIGPNSESVVALGASASPGEGLTWEGRQTLGRARVEYLAPGHRSWWSLALTVARHMGVGHVVSSGWIVLLIAALMATMGVLAARVLLRELT